MSLRSAASLLARCALLVIVHVVLFGVGSALLVPAEISAGAADADSSAALIALPLMAVLDVALLVAWLSRLRLTGAAAWAVTAAVFWGVKTVTSQIEAAFFMPNVDAALAARMTLMTLPLALGLPLLAVVLLGRWRREPGMLPAWQWPKMGPAEWALKLGVLAGVVYPVLFFTFGWFVAFQSDALRAFYGAGDETFLESLRANLTSWVYPLEVFRAGLWIAFALPILFATRGHWVVRGLLTGLVFAVIQNDVHLLPNPLMAREIQLFHFLETASSNVLWGFAIAFALHRSHLAEHR